jgi:response regulator RpfG family c-di-GMP phosphodiesterase
VNQTLLVCSAPCPEIERSLASDGCRLIKVTTGEAALTIAQENMLDAAVLVSTGEKMDVAETVLNLRDVHPAMPIWIIDTKGNNARDAAVKHAVSDNIPDARVVSVNELKRHFSSTQKPSRRKSRSRQSPSSRTSRGRRK